MLDEFEKNYHSVAGGLLKNNNQFSNDDNNDNTKKVAKMASRVQHLHFSGLSRLTGPQARLYLQFLYLYLIHIETSSDTL